MNLLMNFLKHFLMSLLMIILMILLNPERAAGVSRDQVRYTIEPYLIQYGDIIQNWVEEEYI
jgi:hypothetical protein